MGCYGIPLIVMIFCYAKIFSTLSSRAKNNKSNINDDIKLNEVSRRSELDSSRVCDKNPDTKQQYMDLISKSDISHNLKSSITIETPIPQCYSKNSKILNISRKFFILIDISSTTDN